MPDLKQILLNFKLKRSPKIIFGHSRNFSFLDVQKNLHTQETSPLLRGLQYLVALNTVRLE